MDTELNTPSVQRPQQGACSYHVHADLRWPHGTGIGTVMSAYLKRAPKEVHISPLTIAASPGSPLSAFAIARALDHEAGDGVFWSPGFVPPAWTNRPSIVTVHDLTHLHHYSRWHRAYYELIFRGMFHRCTEIVCVSDFTRNEFLAWSHIDRSRVHRVYNGVDAAFTANDNRIELPYPYVLYPGNRRSYKNIDRLLRAYAGSTLPARGIHLVCTGEPDLALRARAHELGISWRLTFAGNIEHQDMPPLYRGALFVAFVSLYEGFGLPILEGMASRVPVLTSNISSMPEIAGDAALTVDPYSVADIAKAMNRLAEDDALRECLIERGIERAQQFDWDRSSKMLWDLIEQASHRT